MDDAAAADSRTLRQTLSASAAQLDLQPTDQQIEQLLGFVALLAKWNRTYNLTSIRDVGSMLSHHVVDCLAVVEPLRRGGVGRGPRRLLDVGSGGGLPGVVIAVMDPSTSVTCVDAVGKKSAFVQQVAAGLGLHNLHSEHARVESLQSSPFDVITSRAFASLADFVRATRQLLDVDGVWMAMKGRRPDVEIADLSEDIDVFHVEQLSRQHDIGERCLVWMRPAQQVSAGFEALKETP